MFYTMFGPSPSLSVKSPLERARDLSLSPPTAYPSNPETLLVIPYRMFRGITVPGYEMAPEDELERSMADPTGNVLLLLVYPVSAPS